MPDEGALWGLCSNGVRLRLMRDNASLTRPAYIEADLRRIFEADAVRRFRRALAPRPCQPLRRRRRAARRLRARTLARGRPAGRRRRARQAARRR